MNPCVYATQFSQWLEAACDCPPSEEVTFRSNKRWATAAKLLDRYGSLPILFRNQQDSADSFVCRYVAKLIGLHFRDDFANDMERQAWLNEKLLLQRDTIKRERDDRFPSWESQFETWELDKFMKAATWYIVCEIRPITPLPLPRLRKLKGDHPLAANYTRGYALCHYPMTEIQVIQEKPLRVVGPPDPSPPKRDLPAPKPPPEVPKPGHRPEPPDPQPHPTQPPRTDPPETQPPPVRA